MDNFDGFYFGVASCSGLCQCTAIISQIRAEVQESMKKGMEASIPPLVDEVLSKVQALAEEVNKQVLAIPSLVKEAVKTELKASIPESVQVEEASRAVPAFLPLAQSLPQPITRRGSPEQDESSNLHLNFVGDLPKSKSFFTKEDIKDQGASLKVELHDQFGNKVDVGPESSAKIKIFVVPGDFNIEDGDGDISKHVVTPREGKPPLLKGNSEISLFKGDASVSKIAFTDNSTPLRSRKFKLGAQVIKGVSPGVSIKAAVSDGFQVKEHRNTFNRKDPIFLDDEVWHLINIGKGRTHKKLEDKGIHLVKDLLHLYNNDSNEVLRIFRGDKKKLNKTMEMAKSCSQSALPIQSQMIPDNSQKQLFDTSYEKQSEQTHIPSMTNLTADEAQPCYSTTLNPMMAFRNTGDAYQSEVQLDGIIDVSWREILGAFSDPCTQAENVYLPTSASNIHLNATGADQEFQSCDLTVDDYVDNESYIKPRRPGWLVFRAVLRFRVAVKVSAKEGPRAGKRQKLS